MAALAHTTTPPDSQAGQLGGVWWALVNPSSNVRCRGHSGSRFRVPGGLLVAISRSQRVTRAGPPRCPPLLLEAG